MFAAITLVLLSIITTASSDLSFHKEQKSWKDSQKECQKLGGNLVRITTQFQNAYLLNELKVRKLGNSWIGLTDQAKEGKFIWVGAMYTNWGSGEPNNAGNEDCVEIVTGSSYGKVFNGKWNDKDCSNKKYFVCQNNAEISFHKEKMTWSDAQKECQQLGGNLVRITTKNQNTYILNELKMRKVGNAWIGLTDQAKEGKFIWIGPMYTNWGPGEPNNAGNEDCAEIVTGRSYGKTFNGKWNDKDCNNKKSFICQV